MSKISKECEDFFGTDEIEPCMRNVYLCSFDFFNLYNSNDDFEDYDYILVDKEIVKKEKLNLREKVFNFIEMCRPLLTDVQYDCLILRTSNNMYTEIAEIYKFNYQTAMEHVDRAVRKLKLLIMYINGDNVNKSFVKVIQNKIKNLDELKCLLKEIENA